MKKIYSLLLLGGLLFFAAGNVWAFDHVIGCAATNSNNYGMVLTVNRDGSWGEYSWDMSKDAKTTFEGKKLYIQKYESENGNIWHMHFKLYDSNMSGTYKEHKTALDNEKKYCYNDHGIYDYDNGSWYTAWTVNSGADFYFDATDWTLAGTTLKLCVGNADNQSYSSALTAITNTKLYYGTPDSEWSNALGICVVGNTTASTGSNWLTDVADKATYFTGFKNWGMNSDTYYLMVNAGASGQQPTMYYKNSYETLLNNTQTIKFKLCDNSGVYQEVSSGSAPGTISVSSYKFDATQTNPKYTVYSNSGEAKTGALTATATAARTAETTLSATASTGYEFVGWFDKDGNAVSSTYYPTGDLTVYAYFRPTSYTRTISSGKWGTLCLPFSVAAGGHIGLDFYSIESVDSKTSPTELYLTHETGDLVAGKPYIIWATTANPVITCGSTITDEAGYFNGLHGTFTDGTSVVSSGSAYLYIVTNNKVYKAGEGCYVDANRAYINMNEVPEKQTNAPGQRVVTMSFDVENTTNIDAIKKDMNAVKIIEDGKLHIIRNGVTYDVTGRVVK